MRVREPYSLYKRQIGKKTVYYYRVYDDYGNRRAFSTGATTKADARAICNQLATQGRLIPGTNETLAEYTADWFEYDKCPYIRYKIERGGKYSKSHASIQAGYLRKHILPFFGQVKISRITPALIEQWLKTMQAKELSTVSINHNLATLKVIFNEAERLGHITDNPAQKIRPLAENSKPKGILTLEEAKQVLLYSDSWQNPIAYTGNLLSAFTGMRLGEVQALRTDSLYPGYIEVNGSIERGTNELKTTKTGRKRYIPLPDKLLRQIEDIAPQAGYIFSMDGGQRPAVYTLFTRALYKALEGIGIDPETRKQRNITFHSWRHFFNSFLRAGNLPDSKVQAVTGHSTQAMTEHYTHYKPDDFKEVATEQALLLERIAE